MIYSTLYKFIKTIIVRCIYVRGNSELHFSVVVVLVLDCDLVDLHEFVIIKDILASVILMLFGGFL